MSNRLATESSPYLRQHAENPVEWYPWGAEAFAQARALDRPILLSVGYAACHWCHVMAHESFEDETTAALMNTHFVNVKVDREERPDVDAIYMQAVQAMTGSGGWPMTVVLTPDGEPYWGGTYFPRDDRHGIPSFTRVLHTVAAAWRDKRDAVARTTEAMRALYENASRPSTTPGTLDATVLADGFTKLAARYDAERGGFTGAPKFPQTMALDFCLRWHARTGNQLALEIAHRSFVAMARGGIYDQVGGGFARYSTDVDWLVPHFEKMLYDNALLTRLGVHLWQVTHDDEVRRVTEEIFAWLAREMTSPEGGFYSSLDADSEGHEGKFYVWDAVELNALLGADAGIVRAYWSVRAPGNFEGKSILHVARDAADVAAELHIGEQEVRDAVTRAVPLLRAAREQRVRPALDNKVLASWNGLMTRALAEAARVFGQAQWRAMAVANGEFLRRHLVRDGRVTRVYASTPGTGPGFLEDHAAVALAFVALYELTSEASWLTAARAIAIAMRSRFRDDVTGVWYDTASDAEPLITRPRDLFDNATPAGNSLALELLLRLAELDGDESVRTEVLAQIGALIEQLRRWPNGYGHVLGVGDMALHGAIAVAILGDTDLPQTKALLDEVSAYYLPTLVLAAGPVGAEGPALLVDRHLNRGLPTGYVCRGFVCGLPVTDTVELARQLSHHQTVTVG